MLFLIGVIILILFCLISYFYLKNRIRRYLNQFGFQGMNLKDIIEEARLEDQEVPKSLSSMDSIYLEQIRKDFPDLNINELKREAERVILDCYNAIEIKNSSQFTGKTKSFIDSVIHDFQDKKIHYDSINIHNTVISSYKKDKGIATIYFSTGFEYDFVLDGKSSKKQDRCKTEFIYVYDEKQVKSHQKVLGIHCPNCGSPITSLGDKNCSYCGSSVIELMKRVFTCNDIVRY